MTIGTPCISNGKDRWRGERRRFAASACKGHNEAIFGLMNCEGRKLHGPMAASRCLIYELVGLDEAQWRIHTA